MGELHKKRNVYWKPSSLLLFISHLLFLGGLWELGFWLFRGFFLFLFKRFLLDGFSLLEILSFLGWFQVFPKFEFLFLLGLGMT